MPPCQESSTHSNNKEVDGDDAVPKLVNDSNNNNTKGGGETVVIVQPAPSTVAGKEQKPPVYVRCNSKGPFINPLSDNEKNKKKTAAEINETELNLHLGQDIVKYENRILVKIVHFLNKFLISWWEVYVFKLWNKVPVGWRRYITYTAWKLYLPIHKFLLKNKTGIHPSQSLEYHAITTFMYPGRMFPVTVARMRFMLQQLTASHPTPLQSSVPETIDETVNLDVTSPPPLSQKDHCRVQGIYLHHRPNDKNRSDNSSQQGNPPPTEYTIFWLYGGAFLAGDVHGNCGPADYLCTNCGMDVFLPTYRLAPEANFHDIIWDVCLAYRYLYLRKQKCGQDPTKIVLFGISSGAALVLRVLQSLAEVQRGEDTLPTTIGTHLFSSGSDAATTMPMVMPSGAILASPFVDYRQNKDPNGSFYQYSKHDLIVNEAVQEAGLPYLDTHMCNERDEQSPILRRLDGLPKLCVVVSEHETVYDETCQLVNMARSQGVPVTVGLWRYMCHVWCFLGGFVPEARQAMNFICDWVNEEITATVTAATTTTSNEAVTNNEKPQEEDDDDGSSG